MQATAPHQMPVKASNSTTSNAYQGEGIGEAGVFALYLRLVTSLKAFSFEFAPPWHFGDAIGKHPRSAFAVVLFLHGADRFCDGECEPAIPGDDTIKGTRKWFADPNKPLIFSARPQEHCKDKNAVRPFSALFASAS